MPVDEIVANLKHIVTAENLQADDEALTLIARQSAGGMRDAQSLLDQLSSTGTKITLALAQTVLGTATSKTVLDIISSILERHPADGLETIHRALDSGADPVPFHARSSNTCAGSCSFKWETSNKSKPRARLNNKWMRTRSRSALPMSCA